MLQYESVIDGPHWGGVRMAYERHGLRKCPEYAAWNHMKSRCHCETDSHYKLYGARGIRVCEKWRESFIAFYRDVGQRPSPGHTLERINNAGSYEPGNVKWATWKEQGRNKSTNRLIEHLGESKTLAQWADLAGINYHTLHSRLRSGWGFAEAVTKPVGSIRPRR